MSKKLEEKLNILSKHEWCKTKLKKIYKETKKLKAQTELLEMRITTWYKIYTGRDSNQTL